MGFLNSYDQWTEGWLPQLSVSVLQGWWGSVHKELRTKPQEWKGLGLACAVTNLVQNIGHPHLSQSYQDNMNILKIHTS